MHVTVLQVTGGLLLWLRPGVAHKHLHKEDNTSHYHPCTVDEEHAVEITKVEGTSRVWESERWLQTLGSIDDTLLIHVIKDAKLLHPTDPVQKIDKSINGIVQLKKWDQTSKDISLAVFQYSLSQSWHRSCSWQTIMTTEMYSD